MAKASEDELDTVFYKYLGGTPDPDEYQDWLELKYAIESIIRTEKLKLLAELDKSMPTTEQLATKYLYHMPERMIGYKLVLHDIREVIEAERKKL